MLPDRDKLFTKLELNLVVIQDSINNSIALKNHC